MCIPAIREGVVTLYYNSNGEQEGIGVPTDEVENAAKFVSQIKGVIFAWCHDPSIMYFFGTRYIPANMEHLAHQIQERKTAINTLRDVCDNFGDNNWNDNFFTLPKIRDFPGYLSNYFFQGCAIPDYLNR